jgi:hypothetical protein
LSLGKFNRTVASLRTGIGIQIQDVIFICFLALHLAAGLPTLNGGIGQNITTHARFDFNLPGNKLVSHKICFGSNGHFEHPLNRSKI